MLRCVGGGVLALDAALGAVLNVGDGGELTPVVCAQHPQALTHLHRDVSLELVYCLQCFVLGRHQRQPHIVVVVVDEEQEKRLPS
jgi:hypothetical protein